MEWRYPWPADDDSDCVLLLLVWCVVWELKSVLCSIRFRHNCVLCCDDVYWWNGMLWQCTGTPLFLGGVLVCGVDTVYVFWSYWGHVFWCGLVVFEKLLWCLLVGTFVWDRKHGVRWCAWCCVSLFFVLSVVHCFLRVMGSCVCFLFCNGEFDSGSGRTLAACLTHASRTLKLSFCWVDEWRTGE